MKYSILNYNDVLKSNNLFRLDAEFYRPDYLKYLRQINNKKVSFLSKILHPTEIKRVYQEGGIKILLAQNVRNNKLDFSKIFFMSEDVKDILKRNRLNYGDVIITRSGANFGQSASFKKDFEIYACADVLVVKKHKELSGGYLSTFLNTKYGRALINRGSYGMSQPHIAPSYLGSLPIPRFNLIFEENVDNLIIKSEEYIKNSEFIYSQAEQILLSEVGLLDWNPKHELSFIRKYSDTLSAGRIDAEYFQPKYDEIIGIIKKYKGSFDKLGNLVGIKKCIEPGSIAYQDNGIPFIRVSNLSKFGISNNSQQYISEVLYEKIKEHQPQKGEILLSKDASPGIAYYLTEEPTKMVPSSGILRLKIKDRKILPECLTLILNSVLTTKQIERDVGGSIINHWRPDQVGSTIIPIIKNDIQIRIKKLLEESFKNKEYSTKLLNVAKQCVEHAIEKDEKEAEKWIETRLKEIGVRL